MYLHIPMKRTTTKVVLQEQRRKSNWQMKNNNASKCKINNLQFLFFITVKQISNFLI